MKDNSVQDDGMAQDAAALREALDKLDKKEDECKDLNDKYLRTLAEMENFRKRMIREQSESVRYANEKILCDLLAVIDNVERAVLHSKEKKDFDALINGLELTMKEFAGVLEKYGGKCIESRGQTFDPARHHAVSTVESDAQQDNTVVEEFRKGYLLNDRILRPSLVSVAKKREGAESG